MNSCFTTSSASCKPGLTGVGLLLWPDLALAVPRQVPAQISCPLSGLGQRLKHIFLLPTFIYGQLSSQACPIPSHPSLLILFLLPLLSLSWRGPRVACRDKPETLE